MQINHRQPLVVAPINHDSHELPSNTLPPEFRIGINIQNRGPAALAVVSMTGPWAKQHRASGDNPSLSASQPTAKRSSRNSLRKKFAGGGNHARQGLRITVAHVLIYAFALFENFGNVVRSSFAESEVLAH